MKTGIITLAVVFSIHLSSCDIDEIFKKDSGKLGGDPNIELNVVGNDFSASPKVNNSNLNLPASAVITKTEGGVNTVRVIADLRNDTRLAKYNSMIPAQYKDAQGRLNVEAKFMATTEGMLDYTNKDQKPFVVVRYNAKVGDTYELKKSDGKTITRTVTQKSTTDDFDYGFFLIKTITVEQDSRIPGISKFVYKLNHKYGLVNVAMHADDGTIIESNIYSRYP